jgi:putative oxidoreductase
MAHGFAKLSRDSGAFAAIRQAIWCARAALPGMADHTHRIARRLRRNPGRVRRARQRPDGGGSAGGQFLVHLPFGFSSVKLLAVTNAGAQFGPPGYELDLLYSACLVALVMGGSGPMAVDGFIGEWRAERTSNQRSLQTAARTAGPR